MTKKIFKKINGKFCAGTNFQVAVWSQIANIRSGKTMTYSQVAGLIGRPQSARAVANACGKNPYPGPIPCHRVIRSDGSLGGYSGKGGIEAKRKLLAEEKKSSHNIKNTGYSI
ncbi:MGMT family protein [Paracoccaceae bacterium]|nr:MGMT family protein [Paracoccaceae bacterium]